MNKYCYTTLLGTDDYIFGVLGLYYSLKKVHSKYPLIVIVPDNISDKTLSILEKNNILYKQVKNRTFSDNICQINYKSTLNKFHCFDLIEYEKVLFLDADVVVYKNIDYYFLLTPFSAFRGYAGTITGGIFLIKPEKDFAKKIFEEYSHCENDEQILNILFLDDFLRYRRFLLEEDNSVIYHHANNFKYWQNFNLDTDEKIEYFINNCLWVLKLREMNYHELRQDGFQNPEVREIYLKYLEENNIDWKKPYFF